jgi:hypothetical protein
MRNKILPLLIGALSLFGVTARANDIEPGKEFYLVPRAANPIVIDGNLNEWSGVPVLADPKFYIRNGAEGTPAGKGSGGTNATLFLFERCFVCAGSPTEPDSDWTGPDDQTSAVQLVYDADNVYLGFVVTDEYHENAANSAWNGDSVQIMIANSNRTQQVALYNYALGGTEEALGSVIVEHEAGPGGTSAFITRNTNTHRTTYEIKLPKESLGLTTLAGGPQFGLGMAINDGDRNFPGQGGWGGLGCHSIVFGKTPSETALITLTRGNDIEPGKEFYTASPKPNNIVIDGSLSEWTGVPVLADPKFYIKDGAEGTPAGKGTAGVGASLFLFERCFVCAGSPTEPDSDWTGPDDQTSAVQLVYDADNVYLGFVVTDEYHENAANSAWNGDSVQIMIANSNRTQQVALYNYALGGTEDNLGAVIVEHEAGPGGTEGFVARNTNTHRTTYEIKLPKASLGLSGLAIGTQFGLGMAINDGDQNFPGQGGWGGLGCHSIVFGKTPSETALITLGTAGGGNDRLFFSAINPTIDNFTFRVSDLGAAVLNPSTVRITIDGVVYTPVASPKNLDATDFTFTPSRPFFPNVDHSYLITATDTLGTTVTTSGIFHTPPYAYLDASDKVTPTDDQPGFLWSIHQNGLLLENSLSRTLHQLAGLLGQNFADPDARGGSFFPGVAGPTPNHAITFELEETLDLNDVGGTTAGEFGPDLQMPGLPGILVEGSTTDGVAVEVTTFISLPAGTHTLVVNSDDGFRTVAGHINDIFLGQAAGQFDSPAGRAAADTAYDIRVAAAGVYPFKTIYYDGAGAASIEWKARINGTNILLNDTVNGGFQTYRRANTPLRTGINMVSPLPGATGVSRNTAIFASILEGATTVDLNSVRLRLDGSLVTVTPTRIDNLVRLSYQPASSLASGQHTAILSYTAGGTSRTQSWTFAIERVIVIGITRSGNNIDVTWTEPGVVLQQSTDLINWTDVTGATSPYRATPDPRRVVIYRLKQ